MIEVEFPGIEVPFPARRRAQRRAVLPVVSLFRAQPGVDGDRGQLKLQIAVALRPAI
jgi:hypothetical protein